MIEKSFKNLETQIINQKVIDGLTKFILRYRKPNHHYKLFKPRDIFKLFNNPQINDIVPNTEASLRFAIAHALHIFKSNTIYSFIPKNACTSLRYSIAIANGFIQSLEDYDWIHSHTVTLSVKDPTILLEPSYSFVILRCPYSRLVSAFFDKFLRNRSAAQTFVSEYMDNQSIDNLSFQDFIYKVCELDKDSLDEHWRPQVKFLLYKEYSRYFALENLGNISEILKKDIGFNFLDIRNKPNSHVTASRRKLNNINESWNLSVKQLREMTELPTVTAMFSNDLVAKVSRFYHEDIEFYCTKFGREGLTFK